MHRMNSAARAGTSKKQIPAMLANNNLRALKRDQLRFQNHEVVQFVTFQQELRLAVIKTQR
jgi:hypothetical protein